MRQLILLLFLSLFLIFIARDSRAQTFPCFTSEMNKQWELALPGISTAKHRSDAILYNIISGADQIRNANATVYTLPVVFHIMHNNGPENVDDTIIQHAVDELNLRFQNSAPYYDSTGHQVMVQFCLATVDPFGNPTTGITRTVTLLTDVDGSSANDIALKNLDRWPTDLYYNIWIVHSILGSVAGYSSFPYSAGQPWDGVVAEYPYLNNSYLLAHESGHYLGLYHTFEGACTNFNCLIDGDQVCDTPPDNSTLGNPCMGNSCSTEMQDTSGFNPFTSDVDDLPNYMDYTWCPNSFSQGQATRMELATVNLRSNLLLSNGCGTNPGQPTPQAFYTISASPCNNGEVTVNDAGTLNAYTSDWDFDGDGIFEATGHNFTFTMAASGTYTVTQRAFGPGGMDSYMQVITVLKGSTHNYPIVNYPQQVTDTIRACYGSLLTFTGDSTGTSWLWSNGATTSAISVIADSAFGLSLSMIDTNGVTWNNQCTPIYVLAYPSDPPVITYDDTLGYTCQGDVVTLYITNYNPGLYYWWVYDVSIGWFNTGSHDTSYSFIPNPATGSQFYVTYSNPAGCNSQSNFVVIQPQYTVYFQNSPLTVNGYTLSTPNSNHLAQWYNYGVPIPGATGISYTVTSTGCYSKEAWFPGYPGCAVMSDTICFLFAGLEQAEPKATKLFPDPVSDHLQLEFDKPVAGQLLITIIDVTGKEIMLTKVNTPSAQKMITIDVSGLAEGLYFLKTSANNNRPLRFLKFN